MKTPLELESDFIIYSYTYIISLKPLGNKFHTVDKRCRYWISFFSIEFVIKIQSLSSSRVALIISSFYWNHKLYKILKIYFEDYKEIYRKSSSSKPMEALLLPRNIKSWFLWLFRKEVIIQHVNRFRPLSNSLNRSWSRTLIPWNIRISNLCNQVS